MPAFASNAATEVAAVISHRRSLSDPVQPEEMNERSGSYDDDRRNTAAGIRAGSLRPPGELGVAQPKPKDADASSSPSHLKAHPRTIRQRQRCAAAVRRGHALELHRALVAHNRRNTTANSASSPDHHDPHPHDWSSVTALCYEGMEVVVGTTRDTAYVLDARSHLVYQRLALPHDNGNPSDSSSIIILGVQSHPTTGQVCVALSSGQVATYGPVETDPRLVSAGRFRWCPGPVVDGARCFYDDTTAEQVAQQQLFFRRDSENGFGGRDSGRIVNDEGGCLQMSLSADWKVLVAHRDQLAVFDCEPVESNSATSGYASSHVSEDSLRSSTPVSTDFAQLLWTTQLPGQVMSAKLSGDSQAIAVVLLRGLPSDTEDEDDAKAATDGVHTFTRDLEDGSDVTAAAAARQQRQPTQRPMLNRMASQGILYKAGPFLVHSSPVTRLSFRGYGHVTSDAKTVPSNQGNDLLLTYCMSDSTARIFGQNNWNPLTEWTTPANTRVDWVQGISAFSLGDLESYRSPKKRKNGPPFAVSPESSVHGGLDGLGTNDSSTLGNRLHFPSIPSHPEPSTNAGAWVVEITFQDVYPALRLSRLTYLKRGMDDLNPTLLESVSAFLPVQCLDPARMLSSDESCLSIEGVWPAWNPWLSESTDLDTTETLSGSAMAYLGLSSGECGGANISGNGGSFGGGSNARLGGPQSPPGELRIVSPHATGGQIVVSEFSVLGDKAFTCVELGNARRTVLSLSQLSLCADVVADDGHARQNHNRIQMSPGTSMRYGSSRLSARVQEGSRSVALSWWRPGTVSFLPQNWLAEDVDPSRAAGLLENHSNTLHDESLIPPPIVLPEAIVEDDKDDTICLVRWWPDSEVGGSPLLIVVTSIGRVLIFEVPPLLGMLEPPMPNYGRPPPTPVAVEMDTVLSAQSFESVDDLGQVGHEYEVSITPDPEYGLGLRLESQVDGMRAIAGSYKRHPLSADVLPAEKVGTIRLGDELLSVNDVGLEAKSFDDIISAVREMGAKSGPGNPIRMKFRRLAPAAPVPRRRRGSFGSDSSKKRRTMETMIGVSPDDIGRKSAPSRCTSERKGLEVHTALTKETAIVATFLQLCGVNSLSNDAMNTFEVLPYQAECEETEREECPRTALLFWVERAMVNVRLVSIPGIIGEETAQLRNVCDHSFAATNEETSLASDSVCSLQVIQSGRRRIDIFVCRQNSILLGTLNLEKEWTTSDVYKPTMASSSLLQLETPWSVDCMLRVQSTNLFATMQPDKEGACSTISVWTSSPKPGCILENSSGPLYRKEEYSAADVVSEFSMSGNAFIDFAFIRSGFLDSSPLLVTFSLKGVSLFQKKGEDSDWRPMAQISYSTTIWTKSYCSRFANVTFSQLNECPRNMFPHLEAGILSIFSSYDERKFVCSEWHPDTLISHVCVVVDGVHTALNQRVRSTLLWLSKEASDTSDEIHPLAVVSLPIVEKHDDSGISTENKEIRRLQSSLLQHLSKYISYSTKQETPLRERNVSEASNHWDLPRVLQSMDVTDLRLTWALGEIVLDPPDFDLIDAPGQLFMFSSVLFQKVVTVSEDKSLSVRGGFAEHSTKIKKSPGKQMETLRQPPTIASAGALAAFVSNDQDKLVPLCRPRNQPMSWEFFRAHRVVFWTRSDTMLAKFSEEIGQSIFRESRDIMECALFFIVSGKMRTLRNLAATAQTESGRIFFKFITKHDFSSDRGRQAAEKNAFSLLRKCKYRAAAAFFLLANPPFLKSAVETIATKMKDLDLAFLVARLTESHEVRRISNSSAMGFGGILGGGGGYAASSGAIPEPSIASQHTNHVSSWKPRVGKETTKLLVDRILPASSDDRVLTSIALLWLGKRNEMAWFLSGNVRTRYAGITEFLTIRDVPNQFFGSLPKDGPLSNGGFSFHAIDKANAFIDFTSSCFLLDCLKSNTRVRCAAALQVAHALSMRGLDLSAVNILQKVNFQAVDDTHDDAVPECTSQVVSPGMHTSSIAALEPPITSSIFDDFVAPTDRKVVQPAVPQSSIFNNFDAPKPKKAQPKTDVHAMQSSIFDDYATPSETNKSALASNNGTMESSIFDSFSTPPVKKVAPQVDDGMQSSIFDDFVATSQPPKPPPVQQPSGGTPAPVPSSILDDFNGPETKSVLSHQDASSATKTPDQNSDSLQWKNHFDNLSIDLQATPALWELWKKQLLLQAAGNRLVRETASVLSDFHGDPSDIPVHRLYQFTDILVTSGASVVLQLPCEADKILQRIQLTLEHLCAFSRVPKLDVIHQAIRLLGPYHVHRMIFSVVLYAAVGRFDLAEDVVLLCSSDVIERCQFFSASRDELVHKKQSRAYIASHFIRQELIRLTWQLESCLWLHRGGGLPLSGVALNEATVAVRIGLFLAGWNRNYECLEAILQNEPDCLMDEDAGRQLWTSIKVFDSGNSDSYGTKKTSSGGWEFLVDCKRSQATELLKHRSTGCFIIRPHPENHGVFTLSFKTNLVPDPAEEGKRERDSRTPDTSGDELSDVEASTKPPRQAKKKVRKDDIVQHAIVRLSDSGFRCGSFGPFASLISLLEAVSSSLPFHLRFDLPPRNRVIKEEGSQTSPNAVLLRKLNLHRNDSSIRKNGFIQSLKSHYPVECHQNRHNLPSHPAQAVASHEEKLGSFGVFAHLLILNLVKRQLSSVVSVEYDDLLNDDDKNVDPQQHALYVATDIDDFEDRLSSQFVTASRTLRPLLNWCRAVEVAAVAKLSPGLRSVSKALPSLEEDFAETSDSVTESADAIEVSPTIRTRKFVDGGDSILRGMIQQESGVAFSTLRLVDGGECTMLILFSKKEAVRWLISNEIVETEEKALSRLKQVEEARVIEQLDLSILPLKQKTANPQDEGVRYRFVDPWEVEALKNREGETRNASLGRGCFVGFSLGKVALSTEKIIRELGGVPLLELWATAKGGIALTKALASVHPAWERSASGDLKLKNGVVTEPPPFVNSIRRCLYRNALYRRLELPQRFMSLVQVELLDLKNLTSPGGSLSLTAYALLRLKRAGSSGTLTNKARTLDSATTPPSKLNKTSGPNAPASWGTVVRFRFPLPEDVSIDGTSFDRDRESLFKGPPRVLQVSVYEKKLLVDHALGTADISLDGLGAGGQLEEWVPLRSEKSGITWFARIRLTLRFELMCLAPETSATSDMIPSVGLQRVKGLCQGGSAHEDVKARSISSPDLFSYFEGIVY